MQNLHAKPQMQVEHLSRGLRILQPPSLRCFVPAGRPRALTRRSTPARCTKYGSSFDSEDDLDAKFSEELAQRMDPDRFKRFSERMDLLWSISKKGNRPETCDCCNGTGVAECSYCHGTGVLTVGDVVFCSMTGCNGCPVCKSQGTVECKNCKGTGKRAGWMKPGWSVNP